MHLVPAWHKIERTSIVLGAPASKTNFLNKTPKEDHDEKVSVLMIIMLSLINMMMKILLILGRGGDRLVCPPDSQCPAPLLIFLPRQYWWYLAFIMKNDGKLIQTRIQGESLASWLTTSYLSPPVCSCPSSIPSFGKGKFGIRVAGLVGLHSSPIFHKSPAFPNFRKLLLPNFTRIRNRIIIIASY